MTLAEQKHCICQDQHRRGYCTEPECPYAVVPEVEQQQAIKDGANLLVKAYAEEFAAREAELKAKLTALEAELRVRQSQLDRALDAGDKMMARLATATKALEAARRIISVSLVGSCTCNTKSPEVKYHKFGCIYAGKIDAINQIDLSLTDGAKPCP